MCNVNFVVGINGVNRGYQSTLWRFPNVSKVTERAGMSAKSL